MTDTRRDDQERDTPMTGKYIAVVVLEATIIALLFLVGWIYA